MLGRIGRDAGQDDVEPGIGAGVWLRIACRCLVVAACGRIHRLLLVLLLLVSIGVVGAFVVVCYPLSVVLLVSHSGVRCGDSGRW